MAESYINMSYLKNEFYADYNKEKRTYYYDTINDSKKEFIHQVEWRKYIDE